jgi:hypothetical protein
MAEPQKSSEQKFVTEETFKGLVDSIREIAESTQRGRQVPAHQARQRTPWNPTGEPLKVRLKAPAVFMNGARLHPKMLSEEEITLLNALKPGLYNKKKWTVTLRRDKSIDIGYSNKTVKHRLELAREAPSLSDMCRKILTEAEARDKRRKAGEVDEDEDNY